MKVKVGNDQLLFRILFILITCFLFFWGLSQINHTISNLLFGIVQLLDCSILIILVVNTFTQLAIVGILCFLTIKATKFRIGDFQITITELILKTRNLQKLGFGVASIYMINIISNIVIEDAFELELEKLLTNKPNVINYVTYSELTLNIIDFIRNGLIVALFFIMLKKIQEKH